MKDFIKSLFEKKYRTGVLPDARTEKEKEKDYLFEEVFEPNALSSTYGTKEEALKVASKYPKKDQKRTLSCVAHAYALALEIDNELEGEGYIELSPSFFYRHRSNYSGEGMNGDNAGQIAVKKGTCRYSTLPTPTTEKEINAVKITPQMIEEALEYRSRAYIRFNNINIDEINSIASLGKGVPILIYATYREWAQEYPQLLDKPILGRSPVQHAVTVLPHSAFMENGKKYVIVQDSAWFGNQNIRFLSEDFINERGYFAAFLLNLKNEPSNTKPKHIFTTVMRTGDNGEEVRWLQRCLQYEGLFTTSITPTGYFGGLTLRAVKEFQKKYASDILIPQGITEPTGYVGMATLKKLNQLFS